MSIAPVKTVFDEITDFLATEPTLEEIIAYKLPEVLEQRALYLLEQNRQAMLSTEERDEMQDFVRMNHFMNMLKIKARLKLAGESA
jgi:hypothetical protein